MSTIELGPSPYGSYSLEALGIVDAPREESFDNLTRLARDIFEVPVSLVSIVQVEKDRQYFKSLQGLPEPWAGRRQTPLSHSFCQHVVARDAPLVIENAPDDQLVCDNLAIRDLNVIAYLGTPIYDPQGEAIGALCVIDGVPRQWTKTDVDTLKQLSACVSDAIRLKSAARTSADLQQAQKLLISDLERANVELEQFAYVASHDLQEPLRAVTSFCRLLESDYGDRFDDDGAQYLKFVVDGAARMQALIRDLLDLSRVDSRSEELATISAADALRDAMFNLKETLENSAAVVTHDALPDVAADARQLRQLLQNLIGNAVKYCKTTPEIHIGVRAEEDHYVFSVSDNGIGIAPKYHDQIFGIFKRLHGRTEYPGTGIGLAICRKIVERWQQEIWIESEEGHGSTFHFSVARPSPELSTVSNPHNSLSAVDRHVCGNRT